ncbi:hypothetical protein FRC07_014289 [Ceratobasidium sp. 392]|nr:hypothetical protein FRC07_014289 [Ceratobasidium sp. 392]
MPRLPMETISAIVDILTSSKAGAQPVSLDDASDYPRAPPKPGFCGIRGLSCTSRKMREVALAAWFRVFYIREPEDWELAVEMNTCAYVYEVRVLATALNTQYWFPNTILARFPRLHTAFIDAHNDAIPTSAYENDPDFSDLLAAFPDANHVSILPRLVWPDTLRRVWVTNTHMGNCIVYQLSKMCPHLEEICISRCTVFSKSVAGKKRTCAFWDGHLKLHEDYFLIKEGINSPWDILLKRPLPKLRKLELGTYNIPGTPFMTHWTKHKELSYELNQNNAYGTVWNEFCSTCVCEFGPGELATGFVISQALAANMPLLEEISWPLFCSAGRMAPLKWTPDNALRLPKCQN